jgi:hypothetical protein
MQISLYEQAPHNWDDLAKVGKPSLGEMAKHFTTTQDMDMALGFKSATAKWLKGYNKNANMTSELRAKAWLEANQNVTINELPFVDHPNKPATFLVVTTVENAEKFRKIATLIGCEVEEL